jgi:Uma2 family endonuclease
MAAALSTLTIAEFEAQFGHEKPHYEFWYGEAVQKSMPTWIHGLLQRILMELLREAGYKAGSEVQLKINTAFQPVPDVIATTGHIERPYPTKPVEIVIEILSDDDPMSRLLTKCRMYQEWGFQQIYVVDPIARLVFRWSEHRLEEVDLIAGQPVSSIWTALDQEVE